jgi:hypothetical protein
LRDASVCQCGTRNKVGRINEKAITNSEQGSPHRTGSTRAAFWYSVRYCTIMPHLCRGDGTNVEIDIRCRDALLVIVYFAQIAMEDARRLEKREKNQSAANVLREQWWHGSDWQRIAYGDRATLHT